jgi:hypothetical protein
VNLLRLLKISGNDSGVFFPVLRNTQKSTYNLLIISD